MRWLLKSVRFFSSCEKLARDAKRVAGRFISMMELGMRIVEAAWPDHRETVVAMFREYAASINADICFQGFEEELASLPGKYACPAGCVLLAFVNDDLAGCGAMRPLAEGACEMKRLYVRPGFRGRDIGRELAEALIEKARVAEYQTMRLDTLATMTTAQALYATLGFKPTAAYYNNPIAGTVYLELAL